MLLRRNFFSLNKSISGLVCSGHIWNEGCKSPDHRILRTYAWLTWDDSRGSKTNFLKSTAATFTKCTCIRGSHSFHQTNTSWASMKKMLSKVSNTNLLSNKILEKIKWCWWAQQQIIEISMKMEFHDLVNKVIALVRPKDVMVYARGKSTSKTTLRISLVLVWFDDSPHSNQSFG